MSNWHHAPAHKVVEAGTYILTAGTYEKQMLFLGRERLQLLQDLIFQFADSAGWQLQAWAVFANHYHIVGMSPPTGLNLKRFTGAIHGKSAIELNKLDGAAGRQVWHETWDTRITYQASFLSRLAYVHNNPVKHGLTNNAEQYPYCSASWFAANSTSAFIKKSCP
jgi:putative transposase